MGEIRDAFVSHRSPTVVVRAKVSSVRIASAQNLPFTFLSPGICSYYVIFQGCWQRPAIRDYCLSLLELKLTSPEKLSNAFLKHQYAIVLFILYTSDTPSILETKWIDCHWSVLIQPKSPSAAGVTINCRCQISGSDINVSV